MGLLTIVSDEKPIIITPFRSSNMEVRVSNNNIRVSQLEYESNQL